MERLGFLCAIGLAMLTVPLVSAQDSDPSSFFEEDFVKPGREPKGVAKQPDRAFQLPSTSAEPTRAPEPAPTPAPQPPAPIAAPLPPPPSPPVAQPTPAEQADGIMEHTGEIMQRLHQNLGVQDPAPPIETPPPLPAETAPVEPAPRQPRLRVDDYLSKDPQSEPQTSVARAPVSGPIRGPIVVQAYVAAEPKAHLLSFLKRLVSLKESGVRIGEVSVVMSSTLYMGLFEAMQDPVMASSMAKLDGGGFSLMPVTEIPKELGVENSPVWIVSAGGQRHVFEGYDSIASMFQADGSFSPEGM